MVDQTKEAAAPPAKALRYNSGKLKWSLVHYKSLHPMIRVLEYGALKYAPDNWKKPMDRKDLLACLQRHVAALMDAVKDEDHLDWESNINHIGHVLCNAMFYSYHFVEDKDKPCNIPQNVLGSASEQDRIISGSGS